MAITAVFILLGSFASGLLSSWEPFLVLGMMLLLGLPHGATDHGLFLALQNGQSRGKKISFYFAYLAIIAAYGLIWWLSPVVAFFIFMLLSVYHFGQSNWVNLDYDNTIVEKGHYLLWGVGILLTPILLHAEEAITIVKSMTGTVVITAPSATSVYYFIGITGLLNTLMIIVLWWQQRITTKRFAGEIFAYALLITMFLTNSLLLGFSVYFVFWHSLASAKDQLQFFKLRLPPTLRRQLFVEVAMTVLGALSFCLIIWFGPGPETALKPAVIGGVFIFISLLTLPHMLLVELLYTHWSPRSTANQTDNNQSKFKLSHSPLPAKKPVGKELTITH
ncbi:MAG: Brp/Blh family beta-carotene 15,15'-dioxygenase [Lewinella sp.]